MNYLFSPDNWEWLWTERNARFLLEGFLINVQIAVIAMVLALIIGLLLALLSLAGITALVLYNSAVLAEIMRAGILSLDRGQGEAATALGLSYRDQMRHVILPQGLRRMVPATVSQLITLNKDTTLVSII